MMNWDCDTDVSKVRDPDLVRLIGNDVAIQVREDRAIVPAVGRAHKALAGLDAKSRHSHDPGYPLVIDCKSTPLKLVGHAPIAIAGQLILDVFDDGDEFGVGQP